jgi:hypothetical protein
MGTDEHVCPDCGQPVATVVRRHKTLGAWVPVWGPGPCRNARCGAYVEESRGPQEIGEAVSRDRPGETAAKES